MTKSPYLIARSAALFLLVLAAVSFGEDTGPKKLPAPRTDGGKPLMQALKDRQTIRSFTTAKLPDQVLSDLLWAAAGINRPETGKRTAPSAKNWREIDVYVASAEGLSLYDAVQHSLVPILAEDIRSKTGGQDFVREAPINLIYVADHAKMEKATDEEKAFYSATDTGFISQNVYLFCASEGLGTVVRGGVDREALRQTMKLRPEQKITLAQTVGYPKAE